MTRKNIRTLLALGATFINLIMMNANANRPEAGEQQAEVNYCPQAKSSSYLSSFDYFYCDINPNATSADFHDERPYSSTSVTNLGLPGGSDHIVHQFGEDLLIIPGNNFQTRMVCHAEPKKQKFFKTVLMPRCGLFDKDIEDAIGLLSKIIQLMDFFRPNELEEAMKQEFWNEIVQTTDDMFSGADASMGGNKLGSGESPDDFTWKSPFSGFGGHGGDDEDDTDEDDPHGAGGLLENLLVPVKARGGMDEDFSGFWLPHKMKPGGKDRKRKPQKRYVAVVPSNDDSDAPSNTIEVTANPVIENLTIIQFALLVGGFGVDSDMQDQLMHLDDLSAAELEQLAQGFSNTITNLDSLIENNTVEIPGLSNQKLVQLLTRIETLIRELLVVNHSLKDLENSRDLHRIRRNLQELISSRLISTILGTNEVSVSDDANQHEILVRVLLETGIDDEPETEVDTEELQDLMDEHIRRIRSGITGEELIQALVKK